MFDLSDKENEVKDIAKQSDKKAGFTIIELMTVMSVIIILIGLLVPALNAIKRYAREVATRNQFYAIGIGLDLFSAEWGDYPESKGGICGAVQLADHMVGRDLMGYDPMGTYLDPNSSGRKLYLQVEKANAYRLGDLYPTLAPPAADEHVLCDEYKTVEHKGTGKLVGMPILYYKANAVGSGDIYDYGDNAALVDLGIPWVAGAPPHPFNQTVFFGQIKNDEITTTYRPYRTDSYILLSAGFDGEYGTGDDIFNF